ncbi:MAG: oxidoreductase [Opitutus sp.]|nr:oxidoreductase [Opitutus sp.]
MSRPLRWGFLSTANICRQNWRALHASGTNVVTALASRDQARAQRFVDENQLTTPMPRVPVAFGSYEELLASPEVDAVYIPLPTGLRAEWIVQAAEAGKHVLGEKPAACSAPELENVLNACRRNGVQFMDGVMFMHHPRLAHLRALFDGTPSPLGELRRVQSMFSFAGAPDFTATNIRAQTTLEPHGCLGDLGWYCLRLSLWAMRWRLPASVTGLIHSSHGATAESPGVPLEFSGELHYPDGASGGFHCSFRCPNQQWAQFSGTAGWLRLEDFVHPREHRDSHYLLNGAAVCVAGEPIAEPALAPDAAMFRNFTAAVASGKLNEDWPKWSLLTQQVMDACYRSALNGGEPVAI